MSRRDYFIENPSKEKNDHQLQTLIFSATLTFTHHIPVRKGEKSLEMTQSQVDPKQKVKKIAQTMNMRKGGKFLAVVDLSTAQKTPKTLIECRMNCMDLLQKVTVSNFHWFQTIDNFRTQIFSICFNAMVGELWFLAIQSWQYDVFKHF